MLFLKDKNIKLETNIKGYIIIGVIIIVLALVYFLGNFNRFTVISLNANNDNFNVTNGVMIQSPALNIIKIDNISYKKDDYLFKRLEIKLIHYLNKENILYEFEHLSTEPTYLNNYLKTLRINIHDKVNQDVTRKKAKIILKISVIDEENNILEEQLIIQKNKLSSNKLIYF